MHEALDQAAFLKAGPLTELQLAPSQRFIFWDFLFFWRTLPARLSAPPTVLQASTTRSQHTQCILHQTTSQLCLLLFEVVPPETNTESAFDCFTRSASAATQRTTHPTGCLHKVKGWQFKSVF